MSSLLVWLHRLYTSPYMKKTQRLLLSIALGLGLGFCFLITTFGALSFIRPGWLRSTLSSGIQAKVLPTPMVNSVSGPTAVPLPTVAGTTCGGPQQMTIALLGVDDRSKPSEGYTHATRTDAITLVNVRFDSPSAALLSFPRDLYVPLPNLENVQISQDRLNTAYLYGEVYKVPGGGPTEFKATIELNFGIRVDRYVMVNFAAFETTVDALGGIDVNVPDPIYDPDFPADAGDGTLVLDIPAGLQHMDGKMALRYARTRHQDDDYHRVKRQQLVLLAIRDKLFSPEVVPQLPALLASLNHSVQTDLSPAEMAALLCLGPRIDRASITAHSIDGTMVIPWTTPTGGSVSIPNREAITPLVNEFLGR